MPRSDQMRFMNQKCIQCFKLDASVLWSQTLDIGGQNNSRRRLHTCQVLDFTGDVFPSGATMGRYGGVGQPSCLLFFSWSLCTMVDEVLIEGLGFTYGEEVNVVVMWVWWVSQPSCGLTRVAFSVIVVSPEPSLTTYWATSVAGRTPTTAHCIT